MQRTFGTMRRRLPRWIAAFAAAALAAAPPPTEGGAPIVLERFLRPGPVAGVVARIDLRDPRVQVELAMAEGPPAESGAARTDCPGRLDVPSAVARRRGFAVALNASYFDATAKRVDGREVPFFIGNCATPVGWHFSEGRLRARPREDRLKAALVVHADRSLSLHARLDQLPADVRCAVGGSGLVLEDGAVKLQAGAAPRHPRSAVGLSADGRTLLLVAVDGRQEGHSRGATLAELGELMKSLGAHSALNLDGGGSTALVVREPRSGVVAVANRPSELAPGLPELRVERPVADVLGVLLRDPEPPAAPPR